MTTSISCRRLALRMPKQLLAVLLAVLHVLTLSSIDGGFTMVEARTLTLCSHPVANTISTSLQARFATESYYAPRFPNVTWKYRFLGALPQNTRNFVTSLVLNGSLCDALLGPGLSSMAIALSPLVDRIWVDWAATSVDLSDKSANPTFSRVIPTDAVGAAVLVHAARAYGWTTMNVLSVGTSYGISFNSGLLATLQATGGTLLNQRVLLASPSNESMVEALSAFAASRCNVMAVVMSRSDPAFVKFLWAVEHLGLQRQLIFLFAENFCSAPIPSYMSFSGAFCATYQRNETVHEEFYAAYVARNISDESQRLAQVGWNPATIDFTADSIFSSFAVDAAFAAMNTLYALDNDTTASTATAKIAALRASTFSGLTGTVFFNSLGDRPQVDALWYNVQNGTQVVVGTVANFTLSHTALALSGGIYVMGALYSPTTLPPALRPPTTTGVTVKVLVFIVLGSVCFVGLLLALNQLRKSEKFAELLTTGRLTLLLQIAVLVGSMILRLFTALSVVTDTDAGRSGTFVVLYMAIISGSLLVDVTEVIVLGMWLHRNALSGDSPSEKETAIWEFRAAQVESVGIAFQDLPVIVLSAIALMNASATPLLMATLSTSVMFFTMRILKSKDRILQFLGANPPRTRRFKSLRAVATFLMIARILSNGKMLLRDMYHPLHSKSKSSDIETYRLRVIKHNPARVRFLAQLARAAARSWTHGNDVDEDEFYALMVPELHVYFDERIVRWEEVEEKKQQQRLMDASVALSQMSHSGGCGGGGIEEEGYGSGGVVFSRVHLFNSGMGGVGEKGGHETVVNVSTATKARTRPPPSPSSPGATVGGHQNSTAATTTPGTTPRQPLQHLQSNPLEGHGWSALDEATTNIRDLPEDVTDIMSLSNS